MRTLPILLLSLFALVACKEKASKENNTQESTEVAQPEASPAATAPAVENSFKGAWLNSGYMARLSLTKSPYKTTSSSVSISEILIGDKEVVLVHGNSEGENLGYEHVATKDENPICELSNGYQLQLTKEGVLQWKNDEKARFHDGGVERMKNDQKTQLVRVTEPAPGISVFEGYVRASLIAGTYSGAPTQVRFDVDGQITGFGEYVEYRVVTRFDDLSDFDMLELKTLSGETKYMAWEIDGDELILYDAIEGSAYVYAPGKELYRLTLVEALS